VLQVVAQEVAHVVPHVVPQGLGQVLVQGVKQVTAHVLLKPPGDGPKPHGALQVVEQ
jgi:hypothetical protein